MGNRYPPIADYGLIGDCHTAALIARDASIDWYCPGRFDAPAVFCRILDADRGGFLKSAPSGSFSVERRYLDNTKRSSDHQGYDVGSSRRILRHLEGLEGEVELAISSSRRLTTLARTRVSKRAVHGAQLFQGEQCIACHTIAGDGGKRGPDLTAVGSRPSPEDLTWRIASGGNNMPAYGANLQPDEMQGLVDFLSQQRSAP